jgi:hypothetical protein
VLLDSMSRFGVRRSASLAVWADIQILSAQTVPNFARTVQRDGWEWTTALANRVRRAPGKMRPGVMSVRVATHPDCLCRHHNPSLRTNVLMVRIWCRTSSIWTMTARKHRRMCRGVKYAQTWCCIVPVVLATTMLEMDTGMGLLATSADVALQGVEWESV